MAHVVRVGIELFDDRRDDEHVHGVVHARHLDEGGVHRIGVFQLSGHPVREEDELRIGQVVEVDHLPVAAQGVAHGLALFAVPFPALRAAGETCGEYRQQGCTKENLFHIPN